MIKIITIGKLKEEYLTKGVNDYLTRLRKYTKVELLELPSSNPIDEGKLILKNISRKEFLIALAIDGTILSSPSLANLIDKTFITHPTITFIIGGSDGLSSEVLNKSNYLLSFSKLTFPHGLFRLILLEQIYRSYKILANEAYHK